MSYQATNWAMEQRGLKPATKIVLIQLANRHNPDYGCFPSQRKLAEDCEMSRASVNKHLGILEEKGLIRRELRKDPHSGAQTSTRYYFAFEDDTPVQNLDTPCLEFGQPPVQNLDTNNVRVKLVKEQEDLFEEFWAAYPRCKRKTDKPNAFTAFLAIISGKHKKIKKTDPKKIIDGIKRYAATKPDPDYIPMPTTWLNGSRWEVDDAPTGAVSKYKKWAGDMA